MLEFVILLGVVACLVWIVWKVRAYKRASDEAELNQAWRVVLDDPKYMERRHNEERKRVVDDARAHRAVEGL